MSEVWKDVVGYEGRYQVSNLGRVKSLPNQRRKSELILKQASHKTAGHKIVNLTSNDGGWKQKCHWIHRLVLEAFVGPCPAGMECCHNDGNPKNNELGNLRWDTDSGNQADRALHGTSNIGERNPQAKLCLADVRIIKQRIADGESDEVISVSFPVTSYAIRSIRNGQNWRHA